MKKAIIWIVILTAILLTTACYINNRPEPSEVDITDNTTHLDLILLGEEGKIPSNLCSERNLNNKIIIIESRYCGACRLAVPILKEIEEELQTEFIFLDTSKKEDVEKMFELGIIIKYTPTTVVGCDVYIGAYPKETFKQAIENFLKSQ